MKSSKERLKFHGGKYIMIPSNIKLKIDFIWIIEPCHKTNVNIFKQFACFINAEGKDVIRANCVSQDSGIIFFDPNLYPDQTNLTISYGNENQTFAVKDLRSKTISKLIQRFQ